MLADRRVDGTCSRSPGGHPRMIADRVPCAETVDTGIFMKISEHVAGCARTAGAPPRPGGGAPVIQWAIGDGARWAIRTSWVGHRRRHQPCMAARRRAPKRRATSARLPFLASALACGNENCASLLDRSRLKVAARRGNEWITADFHESWECPRDRRVGRPTICRVLRHIPEPDD
jgi:hypothetical protein